MHRLLMTFGLMVVALSLGAQAGGGWKRETNPNFTLEWRAVGDQLEVVMEAPTTGWVAVGFEPSNRMKDANFIIAYVKDGKTEISDDFGVATGAHRPDTALGGSSDVRLISGTESDGKTRVSFSIPLDSGDKYDKPLVPGRTYKVIWGHGPNRADNFTAIHARVGSFNLTL